MSAMTTKADEKVVSPASSTKLRRTTSEVAGATLSTPIDTLTAVIDNNLKEDVLEVHGRKLTNTWCGANYFFKNSDEECCDGVNVYVPSLQLCCRDGTGTTNFRTDMRQMDDTCCGVGTYYPPTQICCGDTAYERSDFTGSAECCNTTPYDTTDLFCCGGNIYAKEDFGGAGGSIEDYCCGGVPYDTNELFCCGSTSLSDSPNGEGCCGTGIKEFNDDGCCGNEGQDKSIGEICCGDGVYPPGYKCCGGTGINPGAG